LTDAVAIGIFPTGEAWTSRMQAGGHLTFFRTGVALRILRKG